MFSWKWKTRYLQPIGLDIGHDSIKMIQLAINAGRISVIAAEKARINPRINGNSEELRRFIVLTVKQMLTEGGFRGRNVVSCLPNDRVKITSLRLPETETTQIEQALTKEAIQRFGLDPDGSDAVRYMLAGNIRQGDDIKSELILFAADNETVKSHITMLEEAGLRLVGIDAVPCALFRNFERLMRRQEDKERTIIFIDIGGRYTTIVFGRGGEISFVKQILIGGDRFNQEVASKLGVSPKEAEMLRVKLQMEKLTDVGKNTQFSQDLIADKIKSATNKQLQNGASFDTTTRQIMVDAVSSIAEQLAREISLCFRYYTVTFRGKRVDRAILAGGGAYEGILLDVLRRQLSLEIEVAEPLRGFDVMNIDLDSDRRGLFCEWAVAVGLSLKGWDGNT